MVFAVSVLYAQTYPESGYYRVQNVKSSRYVTIIDSFGELKINNADADLGALRTFPNFNSDKVVSNPGSVIYVERMGTSDKYDLQAQGTGAMKLVQHVLQLKPFSDGTFGAFATLSPLTKYLYEYTSDFGDYGEFGISDYSAMDKRQRFKALPISSSDDSNYFGIAANVQIGSDWYKAMYADFNFKFASSGMAAYYVTKVDAAKGVAVYDEITGNVPRATPVIVKCSSNQPTNNRLDIFMASLPAISGNQLTGIYFCNTPQEASGNKHVDCVEYDEKTMRVLGKTSSGELGFIKAPDSALYIEGKKKYIPANSAFLKVDASAPAELKLVSKDEYGPGSVITITARSYSRAYGDANPTFEYDADGTFTGVPELKCEATATSPVGTYPITVSQGTVTGATVNGIAGVLTITKAPLNVKADDKTRLEGTDNPALTVTYTGFKNGETDAVLETKPTVTTTATKTSAPGTYPITVSGGSAKNYVLNYINGTLTVTEGQLTLTAKSYSREYGEPNPAFGFDQSGTSTLRGTPEITCSATKTSPVGTYDIVISKGSVENKNVTYVNGTLTITKAQLTVTANDAYRFEGEPNPVFTLSYSGWKNGEDESVLTKKPVATTTADENSGPDVYDIVVSGGEATNYYFKYVNGALTVIEKDGIEDVIGNAATFNVYSVSGQKLRSNVTSLKGLPAGIYVVNGKKIIVK